MDGGTKAVTVRVPGSTSNCGAGFDCIGLALQVYNRVTLTCGAIGSSLRPERAGDADGMELVRGAAEAFFAATGVAQSGFSFRIEGDIPPARGVGSSATVIVGVLAALDTLHGTHLGRRRLAEMGTALEGNPENIVGAIFGGFAVSRTDPVHGAYLDSVRVAVPDALRFVLVSPSIEMPTKASRGVLPATVPHADAVRSLNSAAYLAAVFATGEFDKLPHAVRDYLHEPYRLPRIPGAAAAIQDGVAAGAWCGWLSGSGSSVLCVAAAERATTVADAMAAAFATAGVECTARVLAADNTGFVVE